MINVRSVNTGSYLSCAPGDPSAGKTDSGSATEVFLTLGYSYDKNRERHCSAAKYSRAAG